MIHLYKLLRMREEGTPDLSEWVVNEALNASKLEIGGTFRNVLIRKIDEILIPIFAKIIAYIDCNYNLDLLEPNAQDSPCSRFWLAMFGESRIWQLKYSEILEGNVVPGVRGKKSNQDFKCQMPFFWLIRDAVNSQWDVARNRAGTCFILITGGASMQFLSFFLLFHAALCRKTHQAQLCEFILAIPVGAILESVDNEHCEEFYKFYLHDFVRSVHRCKHRNPEYDTMEYQVGIFIVDA